MTYHRVPLRDRARGRWRGILPQLGVSPKHLTGKHGPCPMCGGKDRFRFDDKEGRGTFICNQCGAGDGIELVMRVNRIDFREAAARLEAIIGTGVAREEPKRAPSEEWIRREKNKLWDSAGPISPDDHVGRHLFRRCGLTEFPVDLRTADDVRYDAGRSFPAMIALVRDAAGKKASLHRTYLTPEGHKAPVHEPRLLMPGQLPKGYAIRLSAPAEVLGIGEGVETALSAGKLFGVPCWSALNDSGVAGWVPPPETREVVIFGDNDANHAGQIAAHQLAGRLSSQGICTRVEIPPDTDTDWNDVYTRRGPDLYNS